MGLLDKITGKSATSKPTADKKDEPKKVSKKAQSNKDNVLDMVKEEPKKQEVAQLKSDTGVAHRILVSHHLSEKTNLLSTEGRYVFKISTDANKIEVKKAVEKVYDVHVTDVNIVNTRGKVRRMGRTRGRTSDWKKAIVTLKKGEKIQGLAEGV
jgi:large subunit ribosomal protein L23